MIENPVIAVKNVSKSFGKLCAVQDVSFEVHANSCFGMLGPNGAGKSTIMKMLYGKCLRDSGSIDVFGYDPNSDELAIKFLSGVVSQENNLDDELNVFDNLMIYSNFYGIPHKAAKIRIDELLNFMDLQEKRYLPIKVLSGGMIRRLVIVRALLNNPKLLILDEPTIGLDPQVRHHIWEKLRQLKKLGTTILLTTHYMEEAFVLCDFLMIMFKGKAVAEGTPKELLEKHIEKYVLEIIGNSTFEPISKNLLEKKVRIDRSNESIRLYSDNVQHLQEMAAELEGEQYYLRESNLEDLFLKATGRDFNV
jgi:lipooligosaccharide transport system ATP-binding protein